MDANDVIHAQKCDCDSNIGLKPFVYTPHGHVYTGDMDIVDNIALQELMKKGSKFREIPNLHIHSVKYHLTVALKRSGTMVIILICGNKRSIIKS